MAEESSYQKIERLIELNTELLDTLHVTIAWIIQYSKRTGTQVPNMESLLHLAKEGMKLLNEMVTPVPHITLSDASYHEHDSDASDDNLPVPISSNA